ncbi:hypothetical protein ACLB2K_011214 [Fragaria x ananassa]
MAKSGSTRAGVLQGFRYPAGFGVLAGSFVPVRVGFHSARRDSLPIRLLPLVVALLTLAVSIDSQVTRSFTRNPSSARWHRNCREAIPKDKGKVIILEAIIEEDELEEDELTNVRLMLDMVMMTHTNTGKERTLKEWGYCHGLSLSEASP